MFIEICEVPVSLARKLLMLKCQEGF